MSDNPKKEEEEGLEENASRFVELSNLFTQVFKDFYDNQVKLTNEHEILTKDISSLDKICDSLFIRSFRNIKQVDFRLLSSTFTEQPTNSLDSRANRTSS